MGIKCCKDCQDRHIGCHRSCPEYIAQAQAAREEREKRWKWWPMRYFLPKASVGRRMREAGLLSCFRRMMIFCRGTI